MTDQPSPPPARAADFGDDDMTRASGWDALLDDLFGLNVRALATIWVSFTQPSKLFTAARDADWLGKYTPSIRLVFSLIAVVVFLKFIWTNDASGLFAYSRQTFEALEVQLPGGDLNALTREYLNILLVTYPFTYFGVHAIFALFLRIWGAGTPLPVRIRLYFVAVIPVMLMGLATTTLYGMMTLAQIEWFTLIGLALMIAMYFLVILSGLKPVYPALKQRIGRSALGAGVMFCGDMGVSILSSLWAITWIFATAS